MDTADTVRATPFASSAPDAARAFAERALGLATIGALDEAREAAENALFLVESIAHPEVAARASVALGEAFLALGDVRRATTRFEAALVDRVCAKHARAGLDRVRRIQLPPAPLSAGLRRAFDDC